MDSINRCVKCGTQPQPMTIRRAGSHDVKDEIYLIDCHKCKLSGVQYYKLPADAIEEWNKENPVEDDNVFTPAYIIKLNGGYVINGIKIVVEVDA